MLRLNRTRNELVNNSRGDDDDLNDVTLVNKRAKSPKRRAHHCFGIFQLSGICDEEFEIFPSKFS